MIELATELARRRIDSPLGELWLSANEAALVGVYFASQPGARARQAAACTHPVLDLAAAELAEYFRGERRRFSLPIAPQGTPFQRAVYRALAELDYGELCSYAELARRAGHPGAARAAGAANARNPLSIVVPCHRVIGADGRLTGYAGGLERKRWLLQHERANAAPGAVRTQIQRFESDITYA